MTLVEIAADLRDRVDELSFDRPVTHVYNPLRYAWTPHRAYLERYGLSSGRVLLLGMNPGPFGMAQTGVPFGDVVLVRDWLEIDGPVDEPPNVHPKRPVEGFACPRREVSGSRLWGWAAERFGTANRFFERFFVWNYCPLAFMEEGGRNRTPDKLPVAERRALYEVCDDSLRRIVGRIRPNRILGVGRFAQDRARRALGTEPSDVGTILHPSPASPAANRDWVGTVERQLAEQGIDLPPPAAGTA